MPNYKRDKAEAARWAASVLAGGLTVILDTETTGLSYSDQIIEIAVINTQGQTLLNSLVKPTIPIHPDASGIHGITDADVATAPGFAQLEPELSRLLDARPVVIYNAEYDTRMLNQTARAAGCAAPRALGYSCAMLWYAQWYGDWNDYHGNYRWQKLRGGHRALGDCLATLALIKRMASDHKEGDNA